MTEKYTVTNVRLQTFAPVV